MSINPKGSSLIDSLAPYSMSKQLSANFCGSFLSDSSDFLAFKIENMALSWAIAPTLAVIFLTSQQKRKFQKVRRS